MYKDIYILLDENNYVFYVGQSSSTQGRFHQHKGRFGDNIQIEVIDRVIYPYANFFESHYISLYRSWGFVLKNKSLLLNVKTPKESQKWYEKKIMSGKFEHKLNARDRMENEIEEGKRIKRDLSKRIAELEWQIEEWKKMYNLEKAKHAKQEGNQIKKLEAIIEKQTRKIKYLDELTDQLFFPKAKIKSKLKKVNELQTEMVFPERLTKKQHRLLYIASLSKDRTD